jgi:hypothetical protein
MTAICKRAIESAISDDNYPYPITSGLVVWGLTKRAPKKRAAVSALRARERFALNGPSDAPPLPVSHDEVEAYRNARGLKGMVGFYARSLERLRYDDQEHPCFYDFVCGLMAANTGMWRLEEDEELKKLFPPRPLPGMTPGGFWAPPNEFAKIMASYDRSSARAA